MVYFLFIIIGFIVDEALPNKEFIDRIRLKYMPPEALQFDYVDISFDLWSFGCILIDIYSQKQPIYKINPSREEIYKLHDNDSVVFPVIPTDIQGFLKDVVTKCLERKYKERITVVDLMKNMKIFLDSSDDMAIKQRELLKNNISVTEKNPFENQSVQFNNPNMSPSI